MGRYRVKVSGDLICAPDIDAVATWAHMLVPSLPREFLAWLTDSEYEPSWLPEALRIGDSVEEASHLKEVAAWEEHLRQQKAAGSTTAARAWGDAGEQPTAEQPRPPSEPKPYLAPSHELRELRSSLLVELAAHPRAEQVDVNVGGDGRFSLVTPPRKPRRSAFEIFEPHALGEQSSSTTTVSPYDRAKGGFDFVHHTDSATVAGSVKPGNGGRLIVKVDGSPDFRLDEFVVRRLENGKYRVKVTDWQMEEMPMSVKKLEAAIALSPTGKVTVDIRMRGRFDKLWQRMLARLWPVARVLVVNRMMRREFRKWMEDLDANAAKSPEWPRVVALAESGLARST